MLHYRGIDIEIPRKGNSAVGNAWKYETLVFTKRNSCFNPGWDNDAAWNNDEGWA